MADAITEVFNLVQDAVINISTKQCLGYLQKMRQRQDRLAEVLYNLIREYQHRCRAAKELLPETSAKILAQINGAERDFDDLATFGLRENGLKVTDTPEILFAASGS